MGCARCHNHKYDPIPQRDYYRLAAVFKGAYDEYDWLKPDIRPGIGPVSQDVVGGRHLPYVTTADWKALPPEIKDHEPREGLDGGPDGLRVIERLLEQAPARLSPSGVLLAEIGDMQGRAAKAAARAAFPEAAVKVMPDPSGRDRVLAVHT